MYGSVSQHGGTAKGVVKKRSGVTHTSVSDSYARSVSLCDLVFPPVIHQCFIQNYIQAC